jgi:transglutaminase-like putative cysteine protease
MQRLPRGTGGILIGVLAGAAVFAFVARAVTAQAGGGTCGAPEARVVYDAGQGDRTFTFTYEVEIPPQPAGVGPIDVFVPLAVSDVHQDILRRDLKASMPGREKTEDRYGNRFWHGHLDRSDGKPITVRVEYLARRRVFQQQQLASSVNEYTLKEREELALFLGPDRLVPISGPLIEQVRAEIPKSDPTPLGRARAIFDYVIDTMEYKKVGTGWGHGDTFWACVARYGNCTDYHALFISLARAEGIPARFEIGFSIPEDKPAGTVQGYHCWTEFHLPGVGWFPIDASEADKHPERRDLYFGTQPADRIQFTMGRDLELGEGHTTGPLNYFIYPHVEVAGKTLDDVKTSFRYAEVPEAEVARASTLPGAMGR